MDENRDPLFEDAARLVIEHQNASASFLQRKMSLGYARCARILDELQMAGIIGPVDGATPRKILVSNMSEVKKLIEDQKTKPRSLEERVGRLERQLENIRRILRQV